MGMNRYRNHKALYEMDGWEWTIWPYAIGGITLMITLIAGAANSAPITRSSEFCPIGYYRASAYCLPFDFDTPPALPRTTKTCPTGTYTQSDYCIIPSTHLPR